MVMAAVGIFLLLCCYRRKGSLGKFIKRLSGEVPPAKEIVFLLILLAGITWIMVSNLYLAYAKTKYEKGKGLESGLESDGHEPGHESDEE